MNITSVKGFIAMMLSIAPVMAISLGAWALLITAGCWTVSALLLRSVFSDIKKEERRAAGQAAHRSRGCVVEKTQPNYNI
jgi:hypothetical protein